MEDDKKGSMSDKDRRMAGRFEGFGFNKEDDEEKKAKKSVKIPRRGLFSSREAESPDRQESIGKPAEKKSLFTGLLKGKDVEVAPIVPDNKELSRTDTDDFQEVVYDRLKDVESEMETVIHSDETEAVVADAEFLEDVTERLEEGLPPIQAIDDALEATYIPPDTDAVAVDLDSSENFEPASEHGEDEETLDTDSSPDSEDVAEQEISAPELSSPDTVRMNEFYYRDKNSGDVVVGGAMGYLLGRHRGRRLAEAELEPKIDKKEKQIEQFKKKLETTESQVRAAAELRAEKSNIPTDKEAQDEKEKKIEQQIEKMQVETIESEKESIEQKERQFESVLESTSISNTIETSQDHEKERLTEKPDVITELFDKTKDVRSLTMPELLEVAENIGFEKSNLKELYERHRIDAVNLRRVIIEFMNGGTRYEKILRGSLEAIEMQRELRGEIKHDEDFSSRIATNQSSAHSTSSSAEQEIVSSNNVNQSTNKVNSAGIDNEAIEKHSVISGEVAVALGILTGIAIMLLVMIFG